MYNIGTKIYYIYLILHIIYYLFLVLVHLITFQCILFKKAIYLNFYIETVEENKE